MSFPIAPVDGEVYNGYKYNEAKDVWLKDYSGNVIQVEQFLRPGRSASGSKMITATSHGWQNLMALSITPKKSDSKLLVHSMFTTYGPATTSGSSKLMRSIDGGTYTEIDYMAYSSAYNLNSAFDITTYNHLDSPNYVSTVQYLVQVTWTQGGVVYFGYGDGGGNEPASITISEIAR